MPESLGDAPIPWKGGGGGATSFPQATKKPAVFPEPLFYTSLQADMLPYFLEFLINS